MLNVLPKFAPRDKDNAAPRDAAKQSLLRWEAEVGGQLFGPVPKGHRRQFFCLDEHTWVWHEEWRTETGQTKAVTTRYDVRPNGVLKLQDGQVYQRLSRTEARNLLRSMQLYRQRIVSEYQRLLQTA